MKLSKTPVRDGNAVVYARTRTVFKEPIAAHQGLAHPLAQCKIELDLARLMTQKAARLNGAGDDVNISRATRVAHVSREMILNYVAQHTLGLPESY